MAPPSSSRSSSTTGKRSVSGATSRMPSSSHAGDQDGDSTMAFGAGPRKPSNRPRSSLNSGRIFSTSSSSRNASKADPMPSSDASIASASSTMNPPSSSRTASSSYSNRSGMSALARANVNNRRVSMQPQNAGATSLTADAVGSHVKKLTVDSTSFDEWMKMATDNKINPTNTFSIALIDYFHDMSLLRSDSGDGSINFQKASCTLDGCVKVWTSRVDSVVTETGKLLNGLVGDGKGQEDEGDISGEIELDENGNAIGGGKSKKDKRKRARAKEATLVKNFSAIAVKRLDLEYTVDPLFKKTSADFDEGGAGGLLMNHLGVDDRIRIVFDAGEAPGLPQDTAAAAPEDLDREETPTGSREETPRPQAGHDESTPQAQQAQQVSDLVDISRLQSKLFSLAPPSLLTDSMDPLGDLLQGRQICPTLSRFSFAADQSSELFGQERQDSDDEEDDDDRGPTPFDLGPMNAGVTATPWGGSDDPANAFSFGPHSDDVDGDGIGDDSDVDLFGVPAEVDRDGEVFGLPAESSGAVGSQHDMNDDGGGGFDMFDGGDDGQEMNAEDMETDGQVHWNPRHGPSQHDLLLAFKGISGNDDGQDGEEESGAIGGGLFDYFDQRLMKNWAGPEHWKMRSRLAGFGGIQANQQAKKEAGGEDADGEVAGGKRKRAPKEAFVIDFTSEEGAVSAKDLFEAPKSAATTSLPKSKSRPETYLLPEDHHFSSKSLLRLFTKPRAVLNIRTKKGGIRFGGPSVPGFGEDNGEVDGAYWAEQEAARQAEGVDFGFDDGADGGDCPMPLETHFYHDGDEEGAFELASSMPQTDPNSAAEVDVADYEEADLAAQAAALKRVKPEYVNYAKKAKRVDVRKLKENIWKELGLEGVASLQETEVQPDDESLSTMEDPSQTLSSQGEVEKTTKQFKNVLSGLKKLYPKDKLEEISTSFCFICLLHLANEEGLQLEIGNNGQLLTQLSGVMSTLNEDEEEDDEDDDDEEQDDDDEDDDELKDLKVGRLEYLRIKKDPKAGRSA
ncbi:unnamed protein product [Sympodiomycopsis kandeliae]